MIKCSKCGENKSETDFSIRSDTGKRRRQCINCRANIRRKRYEQNKDSELNQVKNWIANNYEYWQASRAEYYQKNKDAFSKRNKIWLKSNREKVNEWARERRKHPYYKLREAYRGLMRRTTDKSVSTLGYTRYDLEKHISAMFVDGMSWDNYGEWEIDHIKPVKAFWNEGVTDPKIVNALENLQPLWKSENRKKSSSYLDDKQEV